ncbi:MAG TPA: ATP-binding protein [Kofleriaceae bacterium]|nr:ATP-binding protein [Kofleriaceae bacterium]
MRFPPANLQLRRAQLVLMLATLLPTVAMTAVGIVLIVIGHGSTPTLISGVLVLTFCTSVITGYILGSIFVTKGASLARVQNDFTAAISHELRTPVTSIRLFIESLRDGRLSTEDRRSAFELLGRETDRLEQLVTRVLELSRLESGGHAWRREPVDVCAMLDEAVHAFAASTLTNPTPISLDVEPGLAVIGDRPLLVRAVVNLLVNAWKYTGPEKRISIEARTGRRRRIEIVVRDNGIGIDPADQKSIYEQFKRGRAALDSGQPGVGLGLAFVRAIARGHKGKLDFESKPGETAFRIRLKRRRDPEHREPAALVST